MAELSSEETAAPSAAIAGSAGADDPFLAAFVAYWRTLIRERAGPPARADVNPIGMPALLTRLLVVDAPVFERICRIHVAGSGIESIHGMPLAGTGVDTGRFATGEDSLLPRLLRAAPRCRNLVYGEGSWFTGHGERLFGRGVGAPLGDENGGGAVTGVVVCLATLEAAETTEPGGMIAALDGAA